MEEKNLNFDEVIDRRNTDCLKFDFAERRGKPADVSINGLRIKVKTGFRMLR